MDSRDEVDLAKMINDPAKAREFISEIDWRPEFKPEVVVLDENDVIFLNNMTDRDAVRAAHFILEKIEIPKIQMSFEFQFPLN